MDRSRLLMWLDECTGDDVWSQDHCRCVGIPDDWFDSLSEIYETGFKSDPETLYYQGKRILQYRGVLDADLAAKIGQLLGAPVERLRNESFSRTDFVRKIREAIEEG